MSSLVFGGLALVAIVIVAMALSATTHDVALIIQVGIALAIFAVLLRSGRIVDEKYTNPILDAWNNITQQAIGVTGKQTSS